MLSSWIPPLCLVDAFWRVSPLSTATFLCFCHCFPCWWIFRSQAESTSQRHCLLPFLCPLASQWQWLQPHSPWASFVISCIALNFSMACVCLFLSRPESLLSNFRGQVSYTCWEHHKILPDNIVWCSSICVSWRCLNSPFPANLPGLARDSVRNRQDFDDSDAKYWWYFRPRWRNGLAKRSLNGWKQSAVSVNSKLKCLQARKSTDQSCKVWQCMNWGVILSISRSVKRRQLSWQYRNCRNLQVRSFLQQEAT